MESPAFAAIRSQPEFLQAQGGAYMVAGAARMDPWQLAGELLGRELTLALVPRKGGGGPALVAVMEPADADAARQVVDSLLALSGAVVAGEAVAGRSREIGGVRVYELNREALLAEIGGRYVLSNHAATLELIARHHDRADKSLARTEVYQSSCKLVAPEAVAWGMVNIRHFREADGADFDRKADNALAAMLLGGVLQAARTADAAVFWLEADGSGLSVRGRLVGGESSGGELGPFVVDTAEPRDIGAIDVPGLLARVSVSRDWSGLWDQREMLLNADGLRDLLSFAGTLTTLMGNLDFSGELLPSLNPAMHLLAARQEFGEQPPTPQLPGFALLLHLKDAKALGPKLDNAALMTLSIINMDMGQRMQPQYQLSVDTYKGVRMTAARFGEALEPGPRGVRYNFEPTIATVGDRFVIATSRRLMEGIVDALEKLPEAPQRAGRAAADVLSVDLGELYRVLDANRELFVTNRMLEEDLPREKAARQVEIFLDAARLLRDLTVELEPAAGGFGVSARLRLAVEAK